MTRRVTIDPADIRLWRRDLPLRGGRAGGRPGRQDRFPESGPRRRRRHRRQRRARLYPRALDMLAAGRHTALVSATNGKTTTTQLLATALESSGRRAQPRRVQHGERAGHGAG